MSDSRLENFGKHVDATKQHAVDRKIEDLQEEVALWKARYKQLHVDATETETKLNAFIDIEDTTVPRHVIEPLPGRGGDGEATVIAMLSDVHPFTRVRPATVNGVNEFTPAICSKRLDRFFKGVVRLTEIERSGQNIPNLILHLGGDLIGNQIHDELKETSYGTPQEELMFMLEHVGSGIEFLLQHGGFKTITLPCSHGNHDRGTKKKQFENQAEQALTWTLYHVLQREFKDRVKFLIAAGYHQRMDVYGRKLRFHHGDAIMYNGGIGGPTIPINKAIAAWDKTEPVDYDFFGHFHQAISGGRFFANSSVIGYSTYALENKCPFEQPRQWFILLDKKRGITSQRFIYLD
jgi:hypothetical protein